MTSSRIPSRLLSRLRDEEDGLALVVVMAFLVIMTLFATMVLATLTSTQQGSRQSRNVATASAAADAGAEDVIFDLGVIGSDNWNSYVCAGAEDPVATMETTPACVTHETAGDGQYWVTVTQGPETNQRQINAVGEFPAGNGDRRMVRVVVERSAPAAFGFSMFADEQIDIHHHGTILAPQITTTSVHSNGGAKIPVSAEFNVDEFTAVEEIELEGGGDGSTSDHPNLSDNAEDGDIGPYGYSFRYDLLEMSSDDVDEGRCYPTWNPFTRADVSSPDGSYTGDSFVNPPGNGCDGKYFAGNSAIVGDVHAGSLSVGSRAVVAGAADYADRYGGLADAAGRYSVTGDLIDSAEGPAEGNVRVSTEGGVETPNFSTETVGTYDSCNGDCGYDSNGDPNAHAGKIGGTVTVAEDGGPSAIEYPSIDYEETYLPRAQEQEDNAGGCGALDCGKQHVFEGDDEWLDYITDPDNGFYWYIQNNGKHKEWPPNQGFAPDYILLRGDWYVRGGVDLDATDVNERVAEQIDDYDEDSFSVPIVVAGTLVSPDGGMGLKGRLYVVGRGNNTQFLERVGDDVEVDVCKFLNRGSHSGGGCETSTSETIFAPEDSSRNPWSGASFSTVEPGVLAAGGSMDASDLDKDDPWESAEDYEPGSRNATWVRGVVYAGEWDEDEQRSEAQGHHWHNQDPKNSVRIFGAQLGSKLHNCNNFSFTYDSIVSGAYGFSGESSGMQVVSWDEMGAPS